MVVTEIGHYGALDSHRRGISVPGAGIIRVRDGEIVSYQDYMDPIAAARLLGRTADLATALTNA